MSSITATRAPRFSPPPAPTRKRVSRRPLASQGSSVVGRADRPVLRIVADDEQAPVITRHAAPSVETQAPSVEPVETRAPWVEPVETHRVSLDDFFAAEYDGDEQRLEILEPLRSPVRLTRRGRIVVLIASVAAVLGLAFLAASGSAANAHPERTHVVTVVPGQTLWDISARAAGGGDIRAMMTHLEAINHLGSTTLQAGQHLRVPVS